MIMGVARQSSMVRIYSVGLGASFLVFGLFTYLLFNDTPAGDDAPIGYGYPYYFFMRTANGYYILWEGLRYEAACVLGLGFVIGLMLQLRSTKI